MNGVRGRMAGKSLVTTSSEIGVVLATDMTSSAGEISTTTGKGGVENLAKGVRKEERSKQKSYAQVTTGATLTRVSSNRRSKAKKMSAHCQQCMSIDNRLRQSVSN